jgi:excisionase family DNA binding protein
MEGSRLMKEHNPIQPDAIYSREEAAELLGVSLSTVKRLIATGELEASRPPSIRRIFIKGSSILRMLEETRIDPASEENDNHHRQG